MLMQIDKPDTKQFENMEGLNYDFLALVEPDKEVRMVFAMETVGTQVRIHLEKVGDFHLSTMKTMLKDMGTLKQQARDNGIESFVLVNTSTYEDKRWEKLITRMGFPAPIRMAISVLEL